MLKKMIQKKLKAAGAVNIDPAALNIICSGANIVVMTRAGGVYPVNITSDEIKKELCDFISLELKKTEKKVDMKEPETKGDSEFI